MQSEAERRRSFEAAYAKQEARRAAAVANSGPRGNAGVTGGDYWSIYWKPRCGL